MKKNFLINMCMLLLVIIIASCRKNLLDQPPYGVQTDVSYFKTSDDLNKTLTAAYSYLNAGGFPAFEAAFWAIGDVGSDDALKGGGPATGQPAIYELSLNQQKATNSMISLFWSNQYAMIASCNLVLEKQSVVSGDAGTIKKIADQARFLRAFAYYNLVTNFGDVPLRLTFADPSKVDLPRTPKEEVWSQIEKDLTDASALPTKAQWGTANEGRATSGAANAFLGKAYMFQKKYPQAEAAFKKVIDEGTYSLFTDYGGIYRKATGDNNNPESIFDIKHKTNISGSPGEGSTNYYFLQPNDAVIGGNGYDEPTQDLLNEFEPGDPRAIYSITFKGDVFPNGASTYTVSNPASASGRANRKFFIVPAERTSPSIFDEAKSNHIIRYAEVVLLYAEALNENDKSTEALTWLNTVRQRARTSPSNDPQRISTTHDLSYTGQLLPDVTTTDQTAIRNAIWHEQRVELAMEGHRREYLVRTGRLSPRMAISKSIATFDDKFTLLPIPLADIDLSNGQITQNSGY
ncbi:RagB/SusD family nutrient uptake outer membrane protein [soil metagenome]